MCVFSLKEFFLLTSLTHGSPLEEKRSNISKITRERINGGWARRALRASLHPALCSTTFLLKSTPKPIVREQEDSVHYGGGQGESQKFHSVYLLGIYPCIAHMAWSKS